MTVERLRLIFDELIVEDECSVSLELEPLLRKAERSTGDHFRIVLKHLTDVVIVGGVALQRAKCLVQVAAVKVQKAVARVFGQVTSGL